MFQIRVSGNHKSSNRHIQTTTLSGQRQRFADNLTIKAKAVFIITDTFFQTRWLSVSNHKNLLVFSFTTAKQIHRQLQPGYGIGMIRTNFQIRQIFDLNLPGVITKHNDVEHIFGVFGFDEFSHRQRHFFGGRNSIFPIKNHGVTDVNHQHRCSRGFLFFFYHFQIVFQQIKIVGTVVDLGIFDGFCHSNLL